MQHLQIIALLDEPRHVGVLKKYRGLKKTFQKNGLETGLRVGGLSVFAAIGLALGVLRSRSEIYLVRFDIFWPVFFLALMAKFWLSKSRIIVELPSPIAATRLRALQGGLRGLFLIPFISLNKLLLAVSPFEIIYYSYGDTFLEKRPPGTTRLVSNGFDFEDVRARQTGQYSDPENQSLQLICVTNASWVNGLDRLIDSLEGTGAELTIVGEGKELDRLKAQVETKSMSDQVHFLGVLTGDALDRAFEGKHLGVSMLAGHREGRLLDSPLKTREYAARGLPVIGSYQDAALDIDHAFPFFVVAADDSQLDFAEIKRFAQAVPPAQSIRDIGRNYFTVDQSIARILECDPPPA